MANFPAYPMTGYQPTMYQPAYQPAYQQPACQPAQQPPQSGLSGRMVTSREEALGVPVDFMGGLMVFPDVGHRAIYTKLFNGQTGQTDFAEYRRIDRPEAKPDQPEAYALESDVKALRDQVAELTDKLNALRTSRRAQKEEADDAE